MDHDSAYGRYFVLDERGDPHPCDVLTWGAWFATADRHVAQDIDEGPGPEPRVRISTVFLGVDHSFNNGPPVLWETMVFGGPLDGECRRYTSRDDAIRGHAEICKLVTAARETAS